MGVGSNFKLSFLLLYEYCMYKLLVHSSSVSQFRLITACLPPISKTCKSSIAAMLLSLPFATPVAPKLVEGFENHLQKTMKKMRMRRALGAVMNPDDEACRVTPSSCLGPDPAAR